MSEETPPPPRYRLLRMGVRDETTGAEFGPSNAVLWAEYQDWLRAGNSPLPEVQPVLPPDRSYYRRAGENRKARQIAKLTDEQFIAQLRSRA